VDREVSRGVVMSSPYVRQSTKYLGQTIRSFAAHVSEAE
jgi:hypothetical protein